MKIYHQDHVHADQADYEDCVRHDKKLARTVVALFLFFVVLACGCLSLIYAQLVYGDWTCGLPGVECRKVVP